MAIPTTICKKRGGVRCHGSITAGRPLGRKGAMKMKLFAIETGETDWVAAETAQKARDVYMREYGLGDRDMEGAEIAEVDPAAVTVYTDEVDVETEEPVVKTAAEVMADMKRPGVVCSTCV
jgi:hypothetical protein